MSDEQASILGETTENSGRDPHMRRIVLLVTMVALMSVVAASVACAAKINGTNGPDT
jgi:hypothetical protein